MQVYQAQIIVRDGNTVIYKNRPAQTVYGVFEFCGLRINGAKQEPGFWVFFVFLAKRFAQFFGIVQSIRFK